uniref:Uncharacterized protein n=1 Tax=Mesocestoides corti TaxID=53468 RepID=A0A5K3FNA4_MESCO
MDSSRRKYIEHHTYRFWNPIIASGNGRHVRKCLHFQRSLIPVLQRFQNGFVCGEIPRNSQLSLSLLSPGGSFFFTSAYFLTAVIASIKNHFCMIPRSFSAPIHTTK